MKRKGFTLAEALIALGIVAIVAVLALPMFNKTKPDPIKVSYLRTYDSIVKAVGTLQNNRKLYPLLQEGNANFNNFNTNAIFYEYPLLNTQAIKDAISGANFTGSNKKLCEALAYSFGASSNSCNNNNPPTTYTEASFNPSFTTKDGVEFMVNTKIEYKPLSNYTNALYETTIYFDVDGAKGNNCIYNKDSCTSPDRFKVFVLADGTVKAADPAGRYHLKTRTKFNKTKIKPNNNNIDIDAGIDAIIYPENWCSEEEGFLQGQSCSQCENGYTILNDKCACKGKDENGVCKPCSEYQQIWNGEKCDNCSSGKYFVNGECEVCEGNILGEGIGCVTCASLGKHWNGTTCISCTFPEVFNETTKTCGCPADAPFKYGDQCIACDPSDKPSGVSNGTVTCNNISKRWGYACNIGYLFSIVENSCVAHCESFGQKDLMPFECYEKDYQPAKNKCDESNKPLPVPDNGMYVCDESKGWVLECFHPYFHDFNGTSCKIR